jgi:rSAM/selenodomain-associated transferase 1
VLVFAPAERKADFSALVQGRFVLLAQTQGDLGQRLSAFIESQLQEGADAVVVVGTDSPTLPVEYVERAFAELETADVVLGPATDGGYYLLGCGGQLPPVFESIRWSSEHVLRDTITHLSDPQWRLTLLPPWYDVDTPADWAMLTGHIAALWRAGLDPGVPHVEALLGEPGNWGI